MTAAVVILIKFGYAPSQRLDRLVSLLPCERVEVDPLTMPGIEETVVPVPEQARWWARQIHRTQVDQWTIVAYCSASGFAIALGDALQSLGAQTAVAVFDPVALPAEEPEEIVREFAAAAGSHASPPEEFSRASPERALAIGRTYLTAVVDPDDEMTEAIREQLVQRRVAWLSFALSVIAWPVELHNARVLAFLSEHARWPEDFPVMGETHRLAMPASELLQAEEAAKVLAEAVA